jgi:hypothetical protein
MTLHITPDSAHGTIVMSLPWEGRASETRQVSVDVRDGFEPLWEHLDAVFSSWAARKALGQLQGQEGFWGDVG